MLYYAREAAPRIAEAKMIGLKAAEYWRDFALHFYGRKPHFDVALSYIMPYHFWYGRTYMNWMQRMVTDPHVIAAYAKYRNYMEKIHADAPEWWRYNVRVDELLGVELDHPLFFNLESTLNPLNGITGVDFNDPYKRVNWWTNTLDDMGKFGPSLWAPIQWAVAAALIAKGEDDAAARWGGRISQHTEVIKSLTAAAGMKPL